MLYLFYKFGRFLVQKMSIEKCYRFAVFFADIYYLFAKSDRRNLRENLKVVLKTNDKKLINQHIRSIFRNFAKYLADFFRFSTLTQEYILSWVSVKGKENLDKALSKAKGAIALSAHIGSWELGGAVVASLGYPFYAIVLDHKDKRVNDFFIGQRAAVNMNAISMGTQLKSCFHVLKRNSVLAIMGDRDFSDRGRGTKVNFLGRPTVLPRGPAFFSLKTSAPIIPTFLIRKKDNTVELIFEEPIIPEDTGIRDRDVKAITEKYVSVIERYIRTYPDQWYAFRKIWD